MPLPVFHLRGEGAKTKNGNLGYRFAFITAAAAAATLLSPDARRSRRRIHDEPSGSACSDDEPSRSPSRCCRPAPTNAGSGRYSSPGQTVASRRSSRDDWQTDPAVAAGSGLTGTLFAFDVRLYRSRLVILQQSAIVRQLLTRMAQESGLARFTQRPDTAYQRGDQQNDGGGNHRVKTILRIDGPDD